MQGGFRILQPHLVFYFSINKPPSFFFFWGGGGEEYQLYLIAAGHLKGGGSANPSTLPLDPPMRCTCTHFFIVIISILRPEPRLLKLLLSTSIFFYISHHNRDLERRTRTGFKFDFLRVFSKYPTPEGFIVLFSPEK